MSVTTGVSQPSIAVTRDKAGFVTAPTQEQIQPERTYNTVMSMTSTVRTARDTDEIGVSENALLARLSPVERIRYLWKEDKTELTVWAFGIVGGIYLLATAVFHLFPSVRLLFSFAAAAQSQSSALPSSLSSTRDAFDWYVGALMGICLLGSMGAAIGAKNEGKIAFGKDMTKMIVGFAVGFLSGGKTR